MAYDRSQGPPPGSQSAISQRTRQRLYGNQQQQNWQNPGSGGYGFNPDVGAPQTGEGWQSQGNQFLQQLGGGGNFAQILQALMGQVQPQESPSEYLETRKRLRDPAEYARQQYYANTYAAPFAPGGAFEGRTAADTMTPAQIMASQGMSAKNQWASQMPEGSTTASGVDTDELRKLNAANRGRYRTYM
jgi:hypothetical protein